MTERLDHAGEAIERLAPLVGQQYAQTAPRDTSG